MKIPQINMALFLFLLPSSRPFLPPERARQTRLVSNGSPSASASRALGLKECATISSLSFKGLHMMPCYEQTRLYKQFSHGQTF